MFVKTNTPRDCSMSVVPVLPLLLFAVGCATHLSSREVPQHSESTSGKEFVWVRYPGNPLFPAAPGTWRESQTANPDLLLFCETYFLYFRGQQGGHDRIGVATVPRGSFDGVTWRLAEKPVIDVGPKGSWDETHVLDPASIEVDGRVFLYYTAVSARADRAVCLAISDDGVNFHKYAQNPVVIGGAPEVVRNGKKFFLYYWKKKPAGTGYQIHCATSTDGCNFQEASPDPILPAGPPGSWDSHTTETPRIFTENGLYYMVYCGSDRHNDYPADAGLATSRDLIHWTKYSGNPIFSRGAEGAWDEGAIWFTTVEKVNGVYYMWYEGYGGGEARQKAYGSYLKGGKSQVGMATLRAEYFYVKP